MAIIVLTPFQSYGQSTIPGNWTLDRTYTSSDGDDYFDDITFYDGLGYAEQLVQVGASANTGKNIVTPIYYDLVRRSDARVYLPYVTTVSTRTEVSTSSVLSSQASWYNANGYQGQGAYAFIQNDYEASPMNRITASYKPGSAHSALSGDRPVEYGYAASSASDVRKLTVSFSSQSLSSNGFWPAGAFIKTTTTDEDGRTVITFSDLDDRVYLSRVMNGSTAMDTYTVYDAYGNIAWVVTPEGSALLPSSGTWTIPGNSDVNTSNAARFCYIYTYDGLGRCNTRKFPGKAVEELVYDNAGRLTMSRDDGQRVAGKWITYKYSSTGLLLERRLLSNTQSRSYFQDLFYSSSASSVVYPSSAILLEENVYGSYDAATGLSFSAVPGVTVTPDMGRIRNMLTYSRTAVLEGSTVNGYIRRAYYYDQLGHLIQTVESDPSGTLSRDSEAYNFTDNVIAEVESHGSDTKTSQYAYDTRGRILSECTSVNGGTSAEVAYAYDDLGNLTKTYYGPSSSSSTRVTQTDTRNIIGWLTSRTAIVGNSANVFSMSLDYWSPSPSSVTTGLYSGDVTAWHWTQGSNAQRTYVLNYDGSGRLTDSRMVTGGGSTATSSWSERGMTYDRNGNILTLSRYGSSSSSPAQTLTYSYTGNRRSGYAYDTDGRITTDGTGGVTRSYGVLGNPYQTKMGSAVKSQHTFLSDGTRIMTVSGSGTGYVYRGSFVYSKTGNNEILESVGFGGGRIEKNGTGYEVAYYITDHLGSVRSIIKNGTIVEQNDYYPFGGRLADASLPQQTTPVANRWRFSGKEDLSVALGDPVLDFGARMYSPSGAMWLTQDPMAEKYYCISPYAYCAGDPVNRVDPDGKTDYFDNDGNFLWNDGLDNAKIKISTKEAIGNLNQSIDNLGDENKLNEINKFCKASIYFHDSIKSMSDDAIISIYNHYNDTGLKLFADPNLANNEDTKNRAFNYNKDTKQIGVNLVLLKQNSGFNSNSYDIFNAISVHEGKHHLDCSSRLHLTNDELELRAIEAQMNDSSWTKTSAGFKTAIDKYKSRILQHMRDR